MTTPAPPPPEGLTSKQFRDALHQYLQLQAAYDQRVLASLRSASSAVNRELGVLGRVDGAGAAVRSQQLMKSQAAIHDEMAKHWVRTGDITKEGQARAAAAAARTQLDPDLWGQVLNEDGLAYMEASLQATAARGIDTLDMRLSGQSYVPLSESVYRQNLVSKGKIDQIVNDALARGASAQELAKDVKAYVNPNTPGGVRYASMRLARTEINNAFHSQQIKSAQEQPWTIGVKWWLSGSHPVPDECNENAERQHYRGGDPGVYKPDDVPMKPHPQCVIGSTSIQFPGGRPVAATSRWHSGQVVEIITVRGSLTVTPNHPVLTTEGWVAAGALQHHHRVVCCLPAKLPGAASSTVLGDPDEEHVESRAEDVFSALRSASSLGSPTVVRGVPDQFHGDGVLDQEVHVVASNVLLEQDRDAEPLSEAAVHLADADLAGESGGGRTADSLLRVGAIAASLIGGSSPGLALLGSPLGEHEVHRLLACAEETATSQLAIDPLRTALEREVLGHVLRSHAGVVEVNDVLKVEVRDWSGHVYNFQTEGGFYAAQSIITHNCLCTTTTVDVDREKFIKEFKDGKYDEWLEGQGTGATGGVKNRSGLISAAAIFFIPGPGALAAVAAVRRTGGFGRFSFASPFTRVARLAKIAKLGRGLGDDLFHSPDLPFPGTQRLDANQVRSVNILTEDWDGSINRNLREGLPDPHLRVVSDIDDAIAQQLPLTENLTVYRAVGEDVIEGTKLMQLFENKGFTSTSHNRDIVEQYAGDFLDLYDTPGRTMEIVIPRGQRILNLRDHPQFEDVIQEEVLLPRGGMFHFVRLRDDGTMVFEYLGPKPPDFKAAAAAKAQAKAGGPKIKPMGPPTTSASDLADVEFQGVYGSAHVLEQINKVHGIPQGLPRPISIIETNTLNTPHAHGEFRPLFNRIELLRDAPERHNTTAHEYGHALDHNLFGENYTPGTRLPRLKRSREFNKVMKAIRDAPEYTIWTENRDAALLHGNSQAGWWTYMLTDIEMFARAYSQWITERSGSPVLRRDLVVKQSYHWRGKSFDPIAEAFDELFKGAGLLREPPQLGSPPRASVPFFTKSGKLVVKITPEFKTLDDLPRHYDPDGNEEDMWTMLDRVNPSRDTGLQFQNNCHYVVNALELRARGYAVEAMPVPLTKGYRNTEQMADDWIDPATGKSPKWIDVTKAGNWPFTVNDVQAATATWPPDSRGFIYSMWPGSDVGHVYTIFKQADGRIRLVDGQFGVDMHALIGPSKEIGVMRADTLVPRLERVLLTITGTTTTPDTMRDQAILDKLRKKPSKLKVPPSELGSKPGQPPTENEVNQGMIEADSQLQRLRSNKYGPDGNSNATHGYDDREARYAREHYEEGTGYWMRWLKRDPEGFLREHDEGMVTMVARENAALERLFTKNALTEDIIVARGVKAIDHENVRRFDYSKLEAGDYISDPSFMSTTTEMEMAESFKGERDGAFVARRTGASEGWMMVIKVPKGTPALPGADYQFEIILPPGLQQRILSVDLVTHTIYTEVVK